jgi:hypothetical protein
MIQFYFHNREQLLLVKNKLVIAFEKNITRDIYATEALMATIELLAAKCKERGLVQCETKALALQSELVTLQRGYHPQNLEKITIKRHEITTAYSYKILQALEELLRNNLQQIDDALKEAETLLQQIVIMSIQLGKLNDDLLKKLNTQLEVEKFWASLSTDDNISIVQKRLKLMISTHDVIILLMQQIDKLKS